MIITNWHRLDWQWRILVLGATLYFVAVLISFAAYTCWRNSINQESMISRTEIVSRWIADIALEAIEGDSPELAKLESINELPYIERAIIFDESGRVLVPPDMYDAQIDDESILKLLSAEKSVLKLANDSGGIDVFIPVTRSRSSVVVGESIRGIAYFSMKGIKNNKLAYGLVWSFVSMGLVVFLLVWFTRRETFLSVDKIADNNERWKMGSFSFFEKKIARLINLQHKEALAERESDIRRLVYLLKDAVWLFDSNWRLTDMNKEAEKQLLSDAKTEEGTHVVETFLGMPWCCDLSEMVTELDGGVDGVRSRFLDKIGINLSLISFKTSGGISGYAVICS